MTPMERLKKYREEQDYCYAVLDLWGLVKAAGYSWDQVRGFSFRHKFFTKDEVRRHGRQDRKEFGEWWHNCFILHDGTEIQIPLTDRPYDPCKSR